MKYRICNLHSSLSIFHCKGFTLFEIIVVIFLISLTAVLALPSLSFISESRIKSDANKLASILRHLNDEAVSTKETLSLKVDLEDRLIYYEDRDGRRSENIDSIAAVNLQTKGFVKEGEIELFFSPLGAGEAFSFLLSDDRTNMKVSFNHLNAKVKITQNEK
jgi:prepilin-type N-terminal cleavage/methylation domain-containing protein